MSEFYLPPIEQWTAVDPDGTMILRDPIDGRYDPNAPPSYIQQDARISEGLDYLDANGRFFKVNLSVGPLEDEFSLGLPGWAELQIEGADAFGHDIDPALSEPNGHYERIMNLLDTLPDGKAFQYVPGFNTVNNRADAALSGMRQFVDGAFEMIDAMQEHGGLEAQMIEIGELEGYTMAAHTVVLNGLTWYAAGQIGLAAKRHYDGQPPISHTWEAFVPVDPVNADIARKLGLFGVHVDEEAYLRYPEYWYEDDQAMLLPRIMGSGKIL